jgi:carbamoyltransferase
MLVLGISDLEHDTAAALLSSDGVVGAVEEDKLSRSWPTGGIPHHAIDRCLKEAGVRMSDIDLTGMASRPKRAWLRDEGGRLTAFVSRVGVRSSAGAADALSWKLNQSRELRRSLGTGTGHGLINFEHHLCHAASAFYPSDFDRALILTLDQCGDMWSGLIGLGEGTRLSVIRPMRFPNSLGWFYSSMTELMGFRPGRDEHKVQWLSKEGAPEFLDVFRALFGRDSGCLPVLNLQYLANGPPGRSPLSSYVCRELGIAETGPPKDGRMRAQIARSAQEFVEETVIALAETFRQKTGLPYLCLAGGLFLNVLLVRALEERTGFARVFAQPVAGNAGTALGAAYLARKHLEPDAPRQALADLCLGPDLKEADIKAVLDNCKTIYRYLPSERLLVEETVRLLGEDKIVAWCQGRLEFGHRALGNRSILASPFSQYVMENLNKYVKHREDFHPFALSVPADVASESFDCGDNCRFMSSIGALKEAPSGLERFTFNGRSVRVHIVEKSVNPRFWALLRRFGEVSTAPVLVNTSFNLFGEPLVCDPREAIRSFYCSGIDALVIGNFLVVKP